MVSPLCRMNRSEQSDFGVYRDFTGNGTGIPGKGEVDIIYTAVGNGRVGQCKSSVNTVSRAFDGGFLPAPDPVEDGQFVFCIPVHFLFVRMKIPLCNSVGTSGFRVKLYIASDFEGSKGAEPEIAAVADGKMQTSAAREERFSKRRFFRNKFFLGQSGKAGGGAPEQGVGVLAWGMRQIDDDGFFH